MADNGGWASIGSVPRLTKCPECGNDCAKLLEFISKIYGSSSRNRWIFCSVCGKESELHRETISDK